MRWSRKEGCGALPGELTVVILCVTFCYMRSIMNISLPVSLADEVKTAVSEGMQV